MNGLDGFGISNQFFSAPLLNISCLTKAYDIEERCERQRSKQANNKRLNRNTKFGKT